MPFWQRALVTLIAILVVSWAVVAALEALLSIRLPGYLAGVIGGLAGVPVWELLQRVQPKDGGGKGPPRR